MRDNFKEVLKSDNLLEAKSFLQYRRSQKMYICRAILAINPDAKVSCLDETYESLIWYDTPVISKEDVIAKQAELKAAYDALAYSRSRKKEYDLLNQFELISDDSINETTTHKDAILAIKAKYPKG